MLRAANPLRHGPARHGAAVSARRSAAAALPEWIPPQLTQLVETAPEGDQWLHEIKFDGYRMHARLDHGAVRLLTRTGLDWTPKYPAIAKAVAALPATRAYLDGELCGVFPDGITSFSMIQAASDAGNAAGLVFFIFDLLHLDGDDVGARPLIERKSRLAELLSSVTPPLHYSDYHLGQGPAFHERACKLSLEGESKAEWCKIHDSPPHPDACLPSADAPLQARENVGIEGRTDDSIRPTRSNETGASILRTTPEARFAPDSPLEEASLERTRL